MSDIVTWGQLKEKIESSGAGDDTEIRWIDIHMPYDIDRINVSIGEDGLVVD